MKKMTVRLSADIFDYYRSYGQVIERFEVISLFNMASDMHRRSVQVHHKGRDHC